MFIFRSVLALNDLDVPVSSLLAMRGRFMACPPVHVPVLRPSANISSYTTEPSTSTSISFPSSFSSFPTGPSSLPEPVSSSSHSMEITAEIVDMVTILDKMFFLHYLGLAVVVFLSLLSSILSARSFYINLKTY